MRGDAIQPTKAYTVSGAAAVLHLSPRTLNRRRWAGLPPTFSKIGGRIVYLGEDVLAFLRENRQRPRFSG